MQTGSEQAPNDLPAGDRDTRSAIAKAMSIASRISTLALTVVLMGLGGYFLDQYLGTVALFLLLGLGLGMTVAGIQLVQLVNHLSTSKDMNK